MLINRLIAITSSINFLPSIVFVSHRKLSVAIFAVATTFASALQLHPDNWDSETAGKTVFINFFAPWSDNCKAMKPDWDRLMKEYADDKTKGIFEVDCTAAGKPLCDTDDVFYLPTIKSGDPNNLDEYRGGRDYDSFKSHAEGLKPFCSPSQPNFCDKQQLTLIEKLQTLGKDGIEALIAESKKSIADAEQTFKDEMSKLQSAYKQLMQEKDDVIAAVKSSGMGMAKSVLASL